MKDGRSELFPLLVIIGGLLTVCLVGVLWMLLTGPDEEMPRTRATTGTGSWIDQEPLGEVPAFRFASAHGGEVQNADLAGKIWVLDFMYTSCPTICPAMASTLKSLQDRLAGIENLRLVSVTVDPANDTPEALRRWAETVGADPKRWHFLRGTAEEVHRFALEGFGLGDPDDPVVGHSLRFALIDGEGRIRGLYHGFGATATDDVASLEADVRELARRAGR